MTLFQPAAPEPLEKSDRKPSKPIPGAAGVFVRLGTLLWAVSLAGSLWGLIAVGVADKAFYPWPLFWWAVFATPFVYFTARWVITGDVG